MRIHIKEQRKRKGRLLKDKQKEGRLPYKNKKLRKEKGLESKWRNETEKRKRQNPV
jgi:hypothetical protein